MPRSYRFVLLDVFTARPFGGNQLAVFTDARGLSDAEMLTLTREMNLAECSFVLPPETPAALRRVRIFTPVHEMPFAGHPTIGAAFVLAAQGVIPYGDGMRETRLQLNIGVTAVTIHLQRGQPEFAWMQQRVARFGHPLKNRTAVAAAVGLRAGDLARDWPVQIVSTGVPYVIVPVRSLAAIRRAQGGSENLRRLLTGLHTPERVPLAAYLFTLETEGPANAAHARMFNCPPDLPEDAATGSAAGPLAAYLVKHAVLPRHEFIVEQGYEMGRPSLIHAEVTDQGAVRVGGQAVTVGEGMLQLP